MKGMLCQRCGVRRAVCVATSCNGRECYERHLCLECKEGRAGTPTADEQRSVVAPAMQSARAAGWNEDRVAEALGIDAEEIRRVLRGEGVTGPAAWEAIKSHLRGE